MSACHQLRVQSQQDPRNQSNFNKCARVVCAPHIVSKRIMLMSVTCHAQRSTYSHGIWCLHSVHVMLPQSDAQWQEEKSPDNFSKKKKDPQNRPRILLHTYILKTNVTCGQINKTKQEIDRNYLGTGHRPPIPSSTTPKEEAGAGAVHLVRLGSGWSCNMSAAWKRKDERIRE